MLALLAHVFVCDASLKYVDDCFYRLGILIRIRIRILRFGRKEMFCYC